MVPPSARFPTRRAALAEEAARRALAGLSGTNLAKKG